MALLQKLKSLLGFDGADSERSRSREVGVTVEREGTADDGTETAAARDRTEDVRAEPPQSAATDTADETPAQATDADAAAESDLTDSETATEPETTDETDAEPEIEAEAELDTEAEPDVQAESEPEPEPDIGAEPDIGVESEPEPEPEPEPDVESEPEPDVAAEPVAEEPEPEPEPVTEIKGIGPAYADRLAGAGVDTVAELAASDADELADQTDISAKRIQGWIDRAEVR